MVRLCRTSLRRCREVSIDMMTAARAKIGLGAQPGNMSLTDRQDCAHCGRKSSSDIDLVRMLSVKTGRCPVLVHTSFRQYRFRWPSMHLSALRNLRFASSCGSPLGGAVAWSSTMRTFGIPRQSTLPTVPRQRMSFVVGLRLRMLSRSDNADRKGCLDFNRSPHLYGPRFRHTTFLETSRCPSRHCTTASRITSRYGRISAGRRSSWALMATP